MLIMIQQNSDQRFEGGKNDGFVKPFEQYPN